MKCYQFIFYLALVIVLFYHSVLSVRDKKEKQKHVPISDLRSKGIFGSLQSILDYLKQPQFSSGNQGDDQEVPQVAAHRQTAVYLPPRAEAPLHRHRRPVHLKNAVAKLVARIMRGRHILNPFRQLAGVSLLPTTFDTRRAYYSLTKYGVANLVPRVLSTQPVVMERYWLDQVSFAIAKTFKSVLPELESGLYDWPTDLLKPDVTFFINADRKSTDSYQLPNEINNFTNNLVQVYEQFKQKVPIVEISSDQLLMSMANEVMREVRQLGPTLVEPQRKGGVTRVNW